MQWCKLFKLFTLAHYCHVYFTYIQLQSAALIQPSDLICMCRILTEVWLQVIKNMYRNLFGLGVFGTEMCLIDPEDLQEAGMLQNCMS